MPSAKQILEVLRRRGLTVAVAESFTGGRVQDELTDVPGSSKSFVGGVVAYENAVKSRLLNVTNDDLSRHGAVSETVAVAMAQGVRNTLGADVGLATTGIAGPAGATVTKPLGLSVVAVAIGRRTWADTQVHKGSRAAIKKAGTEQAFALLWKALGPKA